MDYDPRDHIPTLRRLLAAWVLCLGIGGLAIGLSAIRFAPSRIVAAGSSVTGPPADLPAMTGARIPRFAAYCPKPPPHSIAVAPSPQGPMSLPIDRCS